MENSVADVSETGYFVDGEGLMLFPRKNQSALQVDFAQRSRLFSLRCAIINP